MFGYQATGKFSLFVRWKYIPQDVFPTMSKVIKLISVIIYSSTEIEVYTLYCVAGRLNKFNSSVLLICALCIGSVSRFFGANMTN